MLVRATNDALERKRHVLAAGSGPLVTRPDMTGVLRQLAGEGRDISRTGLAALSPFITEKIERCGEYATDGLADPPVAFNARLELAAPGAGGGDRAPAGHAR